MLVYLQTADFLFAGPVEMPVPDRCHVLKRAIFDDDTMFRQANPDMAFRTRSYQYHGHNLNGIPIFKEILE
jgi:hypothetical protein